jgi:hypothetical protein
VENWDSISVNQHFPPNNQLSAKKINPLARYCYLSVKFHRKYKTGLFIWQEKYLNF